MFLVIIIILYSNSFPLEWGVIDQWQIKSTNICMLNSD